MRVLSDVPALVVRALLEDEAAASDPFADALRRYREEGAPDIAEWRATPRVAGGRAAEVLRRLTRDLLSNVTRADARGTAEVEPVETPPPNVHAIEGVRETIALEQASDGTWRPSAAAVAHAEEADADARRRVVPQLRSRYPDVGSRADEGDVRTSRFTNITVPAPATREIPVIPVVGTAIHVEPVVATDVPVAPPPAPEPIAPPAPIERESVIKAVASGTEVVAGPFARFQDLAVFVKAIRALPGVQDVVTRQFVRGTVHLRVRHSRSVDLAELLHGLTEFAPSIVSDEDDRIELSVATPDDTTSR